MNAPPDEPTPTTHNHAVVIGDEPVDQWDPKDLKEISLDIPTESLIIMSQKCAMVASVYLSIVRYRNLNPTNPSDFSR